MKNNNFQIALLLLLITLIPSGWTFAQNQGKQIDHYITEKYQNDAPGVAVLVAKNGKIIYDKAFGKANLELNVPMSTNDVFEVGSITKQFTAAAILMLAEEGKLSVHDEITRFLPDYPTHGHKITIHHLLTHTSGIKDAIGVDSIVNKYMRTDMKPLEFIDKFKNLPPDFAPGEKYKYNNTGYFILGYIIEKASGMTYPEFIEKEIFKPLGMEHSYYCSNTKLIRNRASGYTKTKDGFENAPFLSMTLPYAAGGIMSSVHDLLIWNRAMKGNYLLSKKSREMAFTNYTTNDGKKINYGYGWGIGKLRGSNMIEHGGSIFGYKSMALWLPDEDIFVSMLSNRDDFAPDPTTYKIAAWLIGKPFPEPDPTIKITADYAKRITGVYEFEDGSVRHIIYENGQLYSQRKGSGRFKIAPCKENYFVFDGSTATLRFNIGKEKTEAEFESTGGSIVKGVKTNREIL